MQSSPKKKTISKTANPKKGVAKLSRWLHIYLSMVSFAVVLFFSFTGLTLNHPTWFGGDQQVVHKQKGKLNLGWVNDADTNKIAKLDIVELLRKQHEIKGTVSEFRIEESELSVVFKGPAYACDVFIDRKSGSYELAEITMGVVAVMNDLHKGRDSGKVWAWLIDVSAIFLILVSLSGLILLCFLKKRRIAGIVTALIGLILAYACYWLLVP